MHDGDDNKITDGKRMLSFCFLVSGDDLGTRCSRLRSLGNHWHLPCIIICSVCKTANSSRLRPGAFVLITAVQYTIYVIYYTYYHLYFSENRRRTVLWVYSNLEGFNIILLPLYICFIPLGPLALVQKAQIILVD